MTCMFEGLIYRGCTSAVIRARRTMYIFAKARGGEAVVERCKSNMSSILGNQCEAVLASMMNCSKDHIAFPREGQGPSLPGIYTAGPSIGLYRNNPSIRATVWYSRARVRDRIHGIWPSQTESEKLS